MAFVFDPNKPQEGSDQSQQGQGQPQQGQANQPFTSGQGSVITGQTSGNGAGSGAASVAKPSTPDTQKQGNSGQFTNVSQYVAANDPSQLTNQVNSQIGQQVGQANSNLNQATSAVDQSAQQTGQAVAAANAQNSQLGSSLTNAYGWNGGGTTDAQFTGDINAYKANQGLTYQGPTALGNQNVLNAQAANLSDIGAATQNAAGRSALLQRFFGNPTYSGGQNTLDTALLGSQNAQLQQGAAGANAFAGQLDTANRQATNQINQAQQAVTGEQAATNAAIQAQITAGQGAIGQRASAVTNIRNLLGSTPDNQVQLPANVASITGDPRTDAALASAVSNGFMTQDQANSYGNLSSTAKEVGFDPRTLLSNTLLSGTETGDQLNSIAASTEQASRVNALQALVGANTAYTPYSYDPNAAQTDVSNRENALVGALQAGNYNFAAPGNNNDQIIKQAAILGLINPVAGAEYGSYNLNGGVNNPTNNNGLIDIPNSVQNSVPLLKYANQNLYNNATAQANAAAGGLANDISGGFNSIKNLFSDINLKENIKEFDTKPFLDSIQSYQYQYKNKEHGEGLRVSPMAQDLEKTPEGKALVVDTPEGKMVDYGAALGLILSALSDINKRITVLEDTINRSK